MSRSDKRAVTVIAGFLGAGKTTLLRKLLADPALGHVAVIVNEFGEVGLDHELVRHCEQTLLVSGGCACCDRREDLARALRELLDQDQRGELPRLDRVLIETSGLADPAPVLFTIAADPVLKHHFLVDGVVVAVDAINGGRQLDLRPEARKQAAIADTLVLTKVDLTGSEAAAALEARLRRLNPAAEVRRASLETATDSSLLRFPSRPGRQPPGLEEGSHPGSGSIAMDFSRPLDWIAFGVWLSMLSHSHGEQVLRIKGLLDVGDAGPVSVNGVQHVIHPPEHLPEWPDGDRSSKLVLITQDLNTDLVKRSLFAFQVAGSSS